ncbi:putative T7SS-secreted protein [Streptomyces phytophilus]|uniref:putative T7SS-secreted protein n=1 Tax=Streptomyces phytophilus TaxID=722715 RepID=UPI0015F036FD|nr:enoyl-CoA hydratase/isomerase family protein [Streptomyces phytophilus]
MADKDYPTLGFDPAPGDAHSTKYLARTIGRLAGELGTTAKELERLDQGVWKGKAANAFSDHVADNVTPDIKRAHTSFEKAARALRRWSDEMDRFQDEARALEREARRKQEALGDARRLVDAGKAAPFPGASDDDKASDAQQKQQDKREKAAEEAGDALDGVRSRAEALKERYFAEAWSICRELDTAGDIAPDEPGLFDRIASGVSDALGDALDWVQDHADLIKAIGDVLSYVTAALAVLAIVTAPFGIGAAFATAALITGGLTLATHGIAKAAGADVSWTTIGLDALGVIPVAGAFTKGAKLANLEAAQARVAQLGTNYAADSHVARNFVSFGEGAGKVIGGYKPFKSVALWGRSEVGLLTAKGSGLQSRMLGIAQKGYGDGQLIGTKGLSALSFKKIAIDPFSAGGRMLDSGLKMAPKLVTIPQHLGVDVHIGDRFEAAFGE